MGLIILVAFSITCSDKKKPVIGKFKVSRCFKNVKSLQVDYKKSNKKARKTKDIFSND